MPSAKPVHLFLLCSLLLSLMGVAWPGAACAEPAGSDASADDRVSREWACDNICKGHEDVIDPALGRQPEFQTALARVQLRAAQQRRSGELADPMFRLTVQEIGIPLHMQPMFMLMAEQPLPNRNRDASQRHAGRLEVATEAVRSTATEARVRWALRRALLTWQGLAERRAIVAQHLDVSSILLAAAARSAAVQSQPARLLVQQAEHQALALDLDATQEALDVQTDQLNLLGVPLPAMPSAADALADLPELPDTLLAALQTARDPLQATLAMQAKAVAARGKAVEAELAPVWSPGLGLMSMDGMPFGMMVTVGLRWPNAPWLQKRNAARLADVPATIQLLRAEAAEAARRRTLALQQAISTWRSLGRQLRLQRTQLRPLVMERYRALMPQFQAGQLPAADLVAARHQWLAVDLQMMDLRQRWRLARANALWVAAGGDGTGAASASFNPSPIGASASDAMQGH
jgi:hypothetical protein